MCNPVVGFFMMRKNMAEVNIRVILLPIVLFQLYDVHLKLVSVTNHAFIAHLSLAERARGFELHSSADGLITLGAISLYKPSR